MMFTSMQLQLPRIWPERSSQHQRKTLDDLMTNPNGRAMRTGLGRRRHGLEGVSRIHSLQAWHSECRPRQKMSSMQMSSKLQPRMRQQEHQWWPAHLIQTDPRRRPSS